MNEKIHLIKLENRLTVLVDENISDEEYELFLKENDIDDVVELSKFIFERIKHYDVHPTLLMSYIDCITKSVLVNSYVDKKIDLDRLHHFTLVNMATSASKSDIELLQTIRSR